jgi:hypothetical protein
VRVRLQSGASYHGKLAYYTADINAEFRELALEQPIKVAKSQGAPFVDVPVTYQRAVFNEDQIALINVEYRESQQSPPLGRWRLRTPLYRG